VASITRTSQSGPGLLDLVDGDDVGMAEGGGGLRLLDEAAASGVIMPSVGRQDLDRDRSPQPEVARPIHLAHAAGAERLDDFIRAETGAGRECHDGKGGPRHATTARRPAADSAAWVCPRRGPLPAGVVAGSRDLEERDRGRRQRQRPARGADVLWAP
jgi:hypothetical protein